MSTRAVAFIAAATALAILASAGSAFAASLYGVTPDVGAGPALSAAASPFATIAASPDLPYNGGQVLHSNRTHAIFWEPAGSGLSFPPGYEALVEQFLTGVATDSHLPTNVYSLSGQYTDSSGSAVYASTFAGPVVATDPLPAGSCTEPLVTGPGWTACVSDQQLQTELEHVVSTNDLPHGPNDIYFVITPPGLGSCEASGPSNCALGGSKSGSYCGYHSVSNQRQLLYAVIPYNAVHGHCQSGNPRPNANPADPALSTISHEQSEIITDPYGDAWVRASGDEGGDICIRRYGPTLGGTGAAAWNQVIAGGHYYLQAEWSNWDHACEAQAQPDSLSFSLASRPRAGHPIQFVAHAVAAHGRITSYAWSFGLHDTARGAKPRPVLTKPGAYAVTLRSTDSAGLWAFARRTIAVTRR
jgi:hypothetical protein